MINDKLSDKINKLCLIQKVVNSNGNLGKILLPITNLNQIIKLLLILSKPFSGIIKLLLIFIC